MLADTVKLTLKLCVFTFAPLTDTVAVYVPAASPSTVLTVKLPVPFAPMLPSDDTGTVKQLALVPDSDIVSAPVGWLPVLVTEVYIAVRET